MIQSVVMRCLLLSLLPAAGAAFQQRPGTGPVAAAIPAVQGSGDRSPSTGKVVAFGGVATGAFSGLGGYFRQDPSEDGGGAASGGIFVFTGGAAACNADFPEGPCASDATTLLRAADHDAAYLHVKN